jgi:kinesin family protein C2/C3
VAKKVADRVKLVQKKLDEESAKRRALFNQIQELKGNIRVYCRVRPCLSDEEKAMGMGIEFAGQHNDLVVANPDRPQLAPKRFEFEQVFTPQQATQAAVFKEIEPLATSVVDGYNVCIFAYGQTGSGKTHTMEGPKDASEDDLGIYYRSVRQLFQIVDERKELITITVSVNLLEVYNEEIHDLLIPKQDRPEKGGLEIRRGPQGIFVEWLTEVPVTSAKHVLEVLAEGNKNRAVTSTAMNEQSSRSHSMLVVKVQTLTHGTDKQSSAALTLVDLAGSERPSKSNVTGQAMKEAQHINKSLSCLADVIAARGAKSSHVPYRNSKLTALLQESLGGDSKTLMLVHCRPTGDNISETLCTLNFATRVRAVEMGPAGGGGGGGAKKKPPLAADGQAPGAPGEGPPGGGKPRPGGRPRPQR